jgi:hypothetical protein
MKLDALYNRPFSHSLFDSKFIRFLMPFKRIFPYDERNGTGTSKSNRKDNKFD